MLLNPIATFKNLLHCFQGYQADKFLTHQICTEKRREFRASIQHVCLFCSYLPFGFYRSIYTDGEESNGMSTILILLRDNLVTLYNKWQITCTSFGIDCKSINHDEFFWYYSWGWQIQHYHPEHWIICRVDQSHVNIILINSESSMLKTKYAVRRENEH